MLIERLEDIGSSLGGYNALSQLLSTEDLKTIVSFAGPIIVTTIGALIDSEQSQDQDLNLQTFGYIPQTPYYVLDQYYQELYSARTLQYLGEAFPDRQLVATAAHGSYYYVTFTAEHNRPVVLMLLLLRELSPQRRYDALTTIRQAINKDRSFSPQFEVVVYPKPRDISTPSRQLFILMLEGVWEQPPNVNTLYQNPKTKIIPLASAQSQLLAGSQNVWLGMVELTENPIVGQPRVLSTVWQSVNIQGIGTERILSKNDLVYIASTSFSRLSLEITGKEYRAPKLVASIEFDFKYEFNTYLAEEVINHTSSGVLTAYAGIEVGAAELSYSSKLLASGFSYRWISSVFFGEMSTPITPVLGVGEPIAEETYQYLATSNGDPIVTSQQQRTLLNAGLEQLITNSGQTLVTNAGQKIGLRSVPIVELSESLFEIGISAGSELAPTAVIADSLFEIGPSVGLNVQLEVFTPPAIAEIVTWSFGSQSRQFYTNATPTNVLVYPVAQDIEMVTNVTGSTVFGFGGYRDPGTSTETVSGLNPNLAYYIWQVSMHQSTIGGALNGQIFSKDTVAVNGSPNYMTYTVGPYRIKNGDQLSLISRGGTSFIFVNGRSIVPTQYEISITDALNRNVTDQGSQSPTYSKAPGTCPNGYLSCDGLVI